MLKFDVNSMTCIAKTKGSHPATTNNSLGFPPLTIAIVCPILLLRLNVGCLLRNLM